LGPGRSAAEQNHQASWEQIEHWGRGTVSKAKKCLHGFFDAEAPLSIPT
jgi:hypothetical protein